ncbi:MAG: phosphomannomutase/phosphoglucomutase, partial [Planctomycetota bacterium]
DQLDEEAAWKIGYASARFLRSLLRGYQRGQANAQSLCVGRDMRTHSERLAQALIEGMNATGTNVIDIGMIDTPQMYFAINHLGTCGGVQVTASHNPAKYNGFKISGLKATPVGADTGLKDIEHIALALPHTKANTKTSVQNIDLTEEYKNHVLKFLHPGNKNLKIAVDASNGMAGKMVPAVFSDLPLEIIPINFEHKICFDGDADRMMMVDQTGKNISCDLLTALMVPYFLKVNPTATVVYDLRSSWVVSEEIIKYGGTPRRERVGHSFMKKALRDSHAVFGGELSGHFYYRDNYCADSAAITLVHVLNIVTETTLPISLLVKPLRRYYQSGEINFKVEDKQEKMDELARRYRDAKVDYMDGVTVQYKDFWFNCRPSNTEPLLRLNVEAKTKELLDEILAEIKEQLTAPT